MIWKSPHGLKHGSIVLYPGWMRRCWPVNDIACMHACFLRRPWWKCMSKSVIAVDSRCSHFHYTRSQHHMPGGLVCQHGGMHPAVGELHLWLLHDLLLRHPVQWPWVSRLYVIIMIVALCGVWEFWKFGCRFQGVNLKVGIRSSWFEGNTSNVLLLGLLYAVCLDSFGLFSAFQWVLKELYLMYTSRTHHWIG